MYHGLVHTLPFFILTINSLGTTTENNFNLFNKLKQ